VEKGHEDRLREFQEALASQRERVFAILGRYERDSQTVEDLAQETFVKAWKHLGQYQGRAPLEHWIARIAVRVALDHLRRRARRPEVPLSLLGDDALEWLRGPEDAAPAAREAREILDWGMQRLAPEDRLALTLFELEGRSVKEISKLTGWSGVLVRVRLHRARGRLKKILQQLEIKNPIECEKPSLGGP